MSSTAYSNCRQRNGYQHNQDMINEELEVVIAQDSIYPFMQQHSLYPLSVCGQYSYTPIAYPVFKEYNAVSTDEASALAITSNACCYTSTITNTSCCKLKCIYSGKSMHDLKSLAISAISIDNNNWAQIDKNTGLQNKTKMRVQICSFVEECKRSLDDDLLPFIPVVARNNIEYIKIIQIGSQYAGIGFKSDHVSHQLLNGFYGGCAGYESLPRDIFALIMKFGTILEISRIHLDPDYILDHHQLLPKDKGCNNIIDIIAVIPFISNLVIEYEHSDIELEEGEPLSVQSDWEI